MNVLIGILAAAVCIAAEPLLLKYDLPYLYNYNYGYSPLVSPYVKSEIPHIHPVGYTSPYYAGFKAQYDNRDIFGQARYGHIEPGQSHHAVQDIYGNKLGGFSYYNAEGKLKHTSYIADAAGYRVSSNDLPVDTPEVAAAKAFHFSEYEKIKGRSKRDVILPVSTTHIVSPYRIAAPIPHAFPTTHTVPVVKPDGFLADTPEVALAKSLHFAEKRRALYPFTPLNYRYFGYPYLY